MSHKHAALAILGITLILAAAVSAGFWHYRDDIAHYLTRRAIAKAAAAPQTAPVVGRAFMPDIANGICRA